MMKRKSWQEFQATGLFLFVNQFLHIFGWALVYELEDEKISYVYPARVKFRGFDEKSTSEAYRKVSQYMDDNALDLKQEAEE